MYRDRFFLFMVENFSKKLRKFLKNTIYVYSAEEAVRMVTKVSSVYPVAFQKNDQRQTKDGDKKKSGEQFKEILAKALTGSLEKSIRYGR